MLDPHFDFATAEPRLYRRWEEAGCFQPSMDTAAPAYCIVIPPPNVTGTLHMGHALNHTLQDVLIRYHRMTGKNVLWQPGTDHAGIATQMVVERQLAREGNQDRRSMGREAFLERVWQWKAESGGAIVNQDKRLGASADWSRERFTMDEGLSAAVRKVFVELYREGLIYRDKRLVNWDPHFQTAISDLEVENREVDGHMWHFRYPLAGGETYTYVEKDADGNVIFQEERDWISIATTRPETMLGDGAVAVHPEDARYAPIIGKLCEIPVGPKEHRRLIPIITDPYPDPAFGSGAVKITGAHDANDYGVAQRNGIPCYRLMDAFAAMRCDGEPYEQAAARAKAIVASGLTPDAATVDAINLVPDEYRGLDRYECRKRVVEAITAEGLAVMVKDAEGHDVPLVENKKIMQPFGDRSGVVIEPMLTDQWFVNAAELAREARAAVADGRTDFVPDNWAKTYFNWLDNIEPWCISRQLWWGHRIPAWYGPGGKVFVGDDEADARAQALAHYGSAVELVQDEDVLDTWFSSALWPFSTLGWPERTPELSAFYPGAVLVTAFDIIFFWVARMMMMGLKFLGQVPFRHVYIHALVLDEKGQKMSKTKGNVIDPLEIVDEYGADALRFTLASMAAMGRNIRMSKPRVEGYRNFATKLWNAARFCEMNGAVFAQAPGTVEQPINRWIMGEVARTSHAVTQGLEGYRFNEASAAVYRFVWNVFCDWYLELIKPLLNGDDEAAKAETRRVAGWTLDQILKLLHPFMPFVTEELWERLGADRPGFLMLQRWPQADAIATDAAADTELGWVIDAISALRGVRGDLNVPAAAKVPLVVVGADAAIRERLGRYHDLIVRMARLETVSFAAQAPRGSINAVMGEVTLALEVAGAIDLAAEKTRLAREIGRLEGDIAGIDRKLGNEAFLAKAPPEVVEEQHARRAEAMTTLAKLRAARERLSELD